jgi:hypothetical protein
LLNLSHLVNFRIAEKFRQTFFGEIIHFKGKVIKSEKKRQIYPFLFSVKKILELKEKWSKWLFQQE